MAITTRDRQHSNFRMDTKPISVLYLADPNSIHDIKWMSYFSCSKNYQCYVVSRKKHLSELFQQDKFENDYNIKILGSIDDFSVSRLWVTIPLYFKLRRFIKKYGIDVMHIMYAEPNALVSLITPNNIKKILTTRGSDVLLTIPGFLKGKGLLNRVVTSAYRAAFLRFNHITCTSDSQITSVQNILCRQSHNTTIHLIRTGIDLSVVNKRLPVDLNPADKKIIFFPRNMRSVYNHELALEAIELLPDKIKKTYQYVFLNSDSADKIYVEKIRDLISKSSADSVILLPTLSQGQLFTLYDRSELVVITATSDGSPVSAMEAMFFKTPLIIPPLEYDAHIFGRVTRFPEWKAQSLYNQRTCQ